MRARSSLYAAAAITGAAFMLRVRGVDGYVVDLHELFQIHAVSTAVSARAFAAALPEKPFHVLLEPLLTYLVSRVSTELWWLRLQPVLVGTACIPALYALARKTAGPALLSCALLAASLHHVEFSGIVDFYPLLVLWTLLSTLALLNAADSGTRSAFALYAAATTGFLYTHPWAALVLAFHGTWMAAFHRRRLLPFLASALVAAAAFLPGLVYLAGRMPRDPAAVFSAAGHSRPFFEAWWTLKCWAGEPERGLYDPAPFRPWVAASIFLYAGLAALGVWRLRVERRWDDRWWLAAGFAAAGAPAVIILNWLFSYDYMPRQSIFALPFFLLFAAEGLNWLTARKAARWAAPLSAAALFALLFGSFSGQLVRMKNRFARIASSTRDNARPGDALLFDEPNFAAWFLYYYDRAAFLKTGRPALKDGFYTFVLPPGLEAASHPIAVVWDPNSTEDQERRRWAELRGLRASGNLPDANIHFSLMRPMARRKAAEFRSYGL